MKNKNVLACNEMNLLREYTLKNIAKCEEDCAYNHLCLFEKKQAILERTSSILMELGDCCWIETDFSNIDEWCCKRVKTSAEDDDDIYFLSVLRNLVRRKVKLKTSTICKMLLLTKDNKIKKFVVKNKIKLEERNEEDVN